MDWADDIAYAVHDVEDFYRAGLIPLERLAKDDDEATRFMNSVFDRWRTEGETPEYPEDDLRDVFKSMLSLIPLAEKYSGARRERALLRSYTAGLIGRYIDAITLREPTPENQRRVSINREYKMEVTMLKQLTWHYVIRNPALATQQIGQRRVVRELFEVYIDATRPQDRVALPPSAMTLLEEMERDSNPKDKEDAQVRVAADIVAGMTEQQATQMHQRFTGASLGSLLDYRS